MTIKDQPIKRQLEDGSQECRLDVLKLKKGKVMNFQLEFAFGTANYACTFGITNYAGDEGIEFTVFPSPFGIILCRKDEQLMKACAGPNLQHLHFSVEVKRVRDLYFPRITLKSFGKLWTFPPSHFKAARPSSLCAFVRQATGPFPQCKLLWHVSEEEDFEWKGSGPYEEVD